LFQSLPYSLEFEPRIHSDCALGMANSEIRTVVVDRRRPFFKVTDGFPLSCPADCLVRYFGKDCEVVVSGDIRAISAGSFHRCNSIASMRFWENFCASSFQLICIHLSITTISKVNTNKSLSSLNRESGSKLSIVGEPAFGHCSSLRSICLPASIETICESCFSWCENLSDVRFESLFSKIHV
jgi:hypothetical protein